VRQKNEKSNNYITFQWLLPTVFLLVFLVVTLINYSQTMEKSAEEKALDRISRQAISVAGYYNGLSTSIMDAASALADDSVGLHESISDQRQIDILAQIVKKFGLQKGYIVLADYSAIDNDGKFHSVFSEDENLKSLIDAKNSKLAVKDNKGNIVLYYSAPIRTEQEWWGNIVLVFKPNKLESIIDSTTYSYSLIFANGLVGETIGEDNGLYKVGDNINEVLESVTFIDGSQNILTQYIEAGRSGLLTIMNSEGKKEYLSFQPIGKDGACIMVCVREDQVKRSIKEENKDTTNLIYKILISIIVFVALVCSIYIVNRIGFAKQSKELQNKAETDLLTDLLNKVSTEKKIKEYLEGEGKDKVSMMCVLDIDNFKKINDTMGHAFGDEVLSSFGKNIRTEFRVTDIVGRTGGDEFIIFLKDLKDDAIIEREAGRISGFFKNFQVGSYQKYSPTASIGAAIFPRDAQDYESLYKSADTALYKAKKRGKNQLAFYREATDEDKLEALEAAKPKGLQ